MFSAEDPRTLHINFAGNTAQEMLREKGKVEAFLLLVPTDAEGDVLVAVLEDHVTEEQLRTLIPEIMADPQFEAALLAMEAFVALGDDSSEAEFDAIKAGLRSGTIRSLHDIPDTQRALIMTHYGSGTVDTFVFPIEKDRTLGSELLYHSSRPPGTNPNLNAFVA